MWAPAAAGAKMQHWSGHDCWPPPGALAWAHGAYAPMLILRVTASLVPGSRVMRRESRGGGTRRGGGGSLSGAVRTYPLMRPLTWGTPGSTAHPDQSTCCVARLVHIVLVLQANVQVPAIAGNQPISASRSTQQAGVSTLKSPMLPTGVRFRLSRHDLGRQARCVGAGYAQRRSKGHQALHARPCSLFPGSIGVSLRSPLRMLVQKQQGGFCRRAAWRCACDAAAHCTHGTHPPCLSRGMPAALPRLPCGNCHTAPRPAPPAAGATPPHARQWAPVARAAALTTRHMALTCRSLWRWQLPRSSPTWFLQVGGWERGGVHWK